jgi:fucose permease
MVLVAILAFLPLISAFMFAISPMPDISSGESAGSVRKSKKRAVGLALCFACIFFGSCAENTMSNWISSYMENSLGIEKTTGDILGVAMFAILLGLARIAYSRFGKRITRVLLVGMMGATVCYITVGLTQSLVLSFAACVLTGLFTSMLWPGTLIMMEENVEGVGVAAFALLASGGDLGAAVAPQLMGVVIDKISASTLAAELGKDLNITAEQVGLRAGMLISALFPLIGTALVVFIIRYFKKEKGAKESNERG